MDDQIRVMRNERKHDHEGHRIRREDSAPADWPESAEDVATTVIAEQTARGERGTTDEAPSCDRRRERSRRSLSQLDIFKVDSETARAVG